MKININHGDFYAYGELVKLAEKGEYYNKYIFKSDNKDKFLLYVSKDISLEKNSIVNLKGNLKLPSKQRNRGGFDYSKYLYSQKIYGSIFIEYTENIQTIELNKTNLISNIQNSIFENLELLFPKEQLGILIGMIIGDTFYITEDIENSFKLSGITHLLAVSGSNIAYIILITKFLFQKILGRSFANYITIITVILFILVSGATPSVVRAGIMAIILIFSEILSRQPNTYAIIAVTAILILLYNPLIICDIGFILSFGGTLGIVLLNTKIFKYISKKFYFLSENKLFKSIAEMLSVTLSAQIILTPVMWYYFNTISIISILTNLLVRTIYRYDHDLRISSLCYKFSLESFK